MRRFASLACPYRQKSFSADRQGPPEISCDFVLNFSPLSQIGSTSAFRGGEGDYSIVHDIAKSTTLNKRFGDLPREPTTASSCLVIVIYR